MEIKVINGEVIDTEEMKKSARDSWFEMADDVLSHMFLSKAAGIASELFTEEEANAYIVERSKHYIEKYAAMDKNSLHKLMLGQMLQREAREILETLGGEADD